MSDVYCYHCRPLPRPPVTLAASCPHIASPSTCHSGRSVVAHCISFHLSPRPLRSRTLHFLPPVTPAAPWPLIAFPSSRYPGRFVAAYCISFLLVPRPLQRPRRSVSEICLRQIEAAEPTTGAQRRSSQRVALYIELGMRSMPRRSSQRRAL